MLIAGEGRALAPVDVDPPAKVVQLENDAAAPSADEVEVPETTEVLEALPELDAELAQTIIPLGDKGQLSPTPGQPGVFRVQCKHFIAADDLFQVRRNLCWISTVRMIEAFEDGEARSVDDILAAVRGDEAVEYEEGQNYGNVYEIIRALSPKLTDYDQEIAYFAINTLSLDGTQSEDLWGYGLLQAQRFLDQFMGSGDMLASLAQGKPVIVGMQRPIPAGQGEGTFGHAMLLYAADFTVISSKDSTELNLYRVENLVDTIVKGKDLWGKLGRLNDEETNAVDRIKDIGTGLWDGTKKAWRSVTSGDKEIDRPFRLAVHRVYLVDPLGQYPGFTEEVVLTGPEFRQQLKFAISRDKAREIVPITDEAELNAVLGKVVEPLESDG
ncbi:MAG: hypothetical protein AAGJ38_09640 [Planctomycetota bacterium]